MTSYRLKIHYFEATADQAIPQMQLFQHYCASFPRSSSSSTTTNTATSTSTPTQFNRISFLTSLTPSTPTDSAPDQSYPRPIPNRLRGVELLGLLPTVFPSVKLVVAGYMCLGLQR